VICTNLSLDIGNYGQRRPFSAFKQSIRVDLTFVRYSWTTARRVGGRFGANGGTRNSRGSGPSGKKDGTQGA